LAGSSLSALIPIKSPKKEKNPAWAGLTNKKMAINIAKYKKTDFLVQKVFKISQKYGNYCLFQPFQPVFLILRPDLHKSTSYPHD